MHLAYAPGIAPISPLRYTAPSHRTHAALPARRHGTAPRQGRSIVRTHMSRWNLAWLLGIATTALIGFSLTYSAPSRASSLQKKHDNLRLLVDVLDEVQQKYVKELDEEKMRELVENMISGGLQRLDPHSDFVGADQFKQFQKDSKGKFGGIGIRINTEIRPGFVTVESPMVGTPAYEAGILAGDVIVKIDGQS